MAGLSGIGLMGATLLANPGTCGYRAALKNKNI
jgi:hypothetical protein